MNLPLFSRKPTIPVQIRGGLSDHFSSEEMATLSQVATMIEMPAGADLTVEGRAGSEVVVIVSGKANVVRSGEIVATVGPGEIVGEMALLSGEPRNASVVAATDVTILVMTRSEFASLLAQCPRVARSIREIAELRADTNA